MRRKAVEHPSMHEAFYQVRRTRPTLTRFRRNPFVAIDASARSHGHQKCKVESVRKTLEKIILYLQQKQEIQQDEMKFWKQSCQPAKKRLRPELVDDCLSFKNGHSKINCEPSSLNDGAGDVTDGSQISKTSTSTSSICCYDASDDSITGSQRNLFTKEPSKNKVPELFFKEKTVIQNSIFSSDDSNNSNMSPKIDVSALLSETNSEKNATDEIDKTSDSEDVRIESVNCDEQNLDTLVDKKIKKESELTESTEGDRKCVSLSSASDFLQQLVQEQKSQVPTLFCRELSSLHTASKVYSTEFASSAKLPSCYSVPKQSCHELSNVSCSSGVPQKYKKEPIGEDQEDMPPIVTGKTAELPLHYDSLSSEEEDEEIKQKSSKRLFHRKLQHSMKNESALLSAESSGRLRFYLDGRFVLELTHGNDTPGCSRGWVQSKGKIWTPTTQSSGTCTLPTVSSNQAPVECPIPVPVKAPSINFSPPLFTVNAPFVMHMNRIGRFLQRNWLSNLEIRRAARNLKKDLGTAFQEGMKRNPPSSSLFSDSSLHQPKKLNRRKRTLDGILRDGWGFISKMPKLSSTATNEEQPSKYEETDSKMNHSLLLDALTKPKPREVKSSDAADFSLKDSDTERLRSDLNKSSSALLERPSQALGFTKCKTSLADNHMEDSSSKGRHNMPPLLPLPEWYLDPSKAEIPISEMIGYPRPYFPPSQNRPLVMNHSKQQNILNCDPSSSRISLKQEELNRYSCDMDSEEKMKDKNLQLWQSWMEKLEAEDSISVRPDSEAELDQDELTSLNGPSKSRLGKRFGSYGRGHAVSEAIRTFVIADIVNLGGNVETRYVPHGVYAEVASRYKIDVSTTTKWWLRHCSDHEQMNRKDRSPELSPISVPTKSESSTGITTKVLNREKPYGLALNSSSRASTTSVESSYNMHNWNSSELSEGEYRLTSAWTSNRNNSPKFTSEHSSSQMETISDKPLDLRISSKKEKIHLYSPLEEEIQKSGSSREINMYPYQNLEGQDLKIQPSSSHSSTSDSVASSYRNIPSRSPIGMNPVHFSSGHTKDNKSRTASESSSELNEYCAKKQLMKHVNGVRLSKVKDVISVHSPDTDSHKLVDSEYPMLSSALMSPLECPTSKPTSLRNTNSNASETQCQKKQSVSTSSHDSKALSETVASGSKLHNSSSYSLVTGTAKSVNEYPPLRIPVGPLHPEYPSGVPPPPHQPLALAGWPYPPCPVIGYGPALVNSYYYCCCFLPGCRLHYLCTADGRPVDPSEAVNATSPVLLADGYSKYAPFMHSPAQHEQLYKGWNTSLPGSADIQSSPILPSNKNEERMSKTPVPNQIERPLSNHSTESTGSMLKDLLLKPSRTTPDKAVASSSSGIKSPGIRCANKLSSVQCTSNGELSSKCQNSSSPSTPVSVEERSHTKEKPLNELHSNFKERTETEHMYPTYNASPKSFLKNRTCGKTESVQSTAERNEIQKECWESKTFHKPFTFQIGSILEAEDS